MKHSIIRLLGILLSLVLMLGLMSGMGLTVYAEPTGTGIDGQNNKTNENSTLREESAQTTRPLNAEEQVILEEEKAKVRAQYGENRKITDEQICCTERHMDEKAGLYTAGFFCRGTFEIPIPHPSQQKPTPEPTASGTRLLATPTTAIPKRLR